MNNLPPVQIAYFPLQGGLNLVTPPLSMPDGMCRQALNFEADIDGGYKRVAGYERMDGRPAPSAAIYSIIYCTFVSAPAIGTTITGVTSGATGVVIALGLDYIAFTKKTGVFQAAESLQVAAITVATTTGTVFNESAPTAILGVQYAGLAADVYRADIAAVPGSGSILGVHRYNNLIYAFRNNIGATEAKMYKSSITGWKLVSLGFEVAFVNANTNVNDLDTLTQGVVTASINRVVVETGSLLSGVNTGRLILGTPAGGSFAAAAATSTGGGTVTLSGASTAITLAPSGRYEMLNYNFGGLANTSKMYGASGVHKAFEFDGSVFVPIRTGMVNDTPKHIIAHNNHLALSFDGSVQLSGVATPYVWTVITGAAELAMGDKVTGFMSLVGSNGTAALAVFTTNKTSILYGTNVSNFNLATLSFEAGGFDYTAQNIGQGYVFDTLGVRQIAAVQNFGNFSSEQITKVIRPLMLEKIGRAVGSCLSSARNQYRLLFNDKSALYITVDSDKIIGMMPVFYAHTMTCINSFESDTGEEYILAGDTTGFVYRMDKGTSFDGQEISAYLNLSFNHAKTPRLRKRYRKAVYEISGGTYAEIEATYELGYGKLEIEQGINATLATPLGISYWDSFVWDSFYWDGRTLLPIEQDLTGTAENISLIVRSNSSVFLPFTINSAIIHFTPRRSMR